MCRCRSRRRSGVRIDKKDDRYDALTLQISLGKVQATKLGWSSGSLATETNARLASYSSFEYLDTMTTKH